MQKVLLIGLILAPAIACGQDATNDGPASERFRIYLQAFSPALDTEVRLDSSNGQPGTTINFEQNLGLEDTKTVPAAGFAWRFAKRHRLRFDFFKLNRSSAAFTTSEIRFGDQVFQAELPISSFFDTEVYSLGYGYSIIRNERAELGLIAGLSVQDIAVGLKSNRGSLAILEEESELTAPLPTFGLAGAYALNDKWLLRAVASYFALELGLSEEENLGGEIINLEFGIEYLAFTNLSFELRYAYFNVDAEFTNERRLTTIKYQYRGPKLGIGIRF